MTDDDGAEAITTQHLLARPKSAKDIDSSAANASRHVTTARTKSQRMLPQQLVAMSLTGKAPDGEDDTSQEQSSPPADAVPPAPPKSPESSESSSGDGVEPASDTVESTSKVTGLQHSNSSSASASATESMDESESDDNDTRPDTTRLLATLPSSEANTRSVCMCGVCV